MVLRNFRSFLNGVFEGESFSGSSRLYLHFYVFKSIEGFQDDTLSFLDSPCLGGSLWGSGHVLIAFLGTTDRISNILLRLLCFRLPLRAFLIQLRSFQEGASKLVENSIRRSQNVHDAGLPTAATCRVKCARFCLSNA